jgi:ribonuclease HI
VPRLVHDALETFLSQAVCIISTVRAIVHVDGGARGNPGPAAAGCVISTPAGEILGEHAELLGEVTNNVAEYRALLLGLRHARDLGVTEVEVVNDSELIAKQINGQYKVKHAAMRPLYLDALAALRGFERWSVRTVPRAQNAQADALVNAALDQARDAGRL